MDIILSLFTYLSVLLILTASSPFSLSMSTILLSMTMGIMCLVLDIPWMLYTIVIMFLGGMMVVFTYAASASANNKHLIDKKTLLLGASLLLLQSFLSVNLLDTPVKGFIMLNYDYCALMSILLISGLITYTLGLVLKLVSTNEGPIKM